MSSERNISSLTKESLSTSAETLAIDVSVVTGTLNRVSLLKECIRSVRRNGFAGNLEIIAVDGGSKDGTLRWLARQHDILTIVQPNYKITFPGHAPRLAHSWGEFMNIGFRMCRGKWILMVSDDLVLSRGCIQKGFCALEALLQQGQDIGAGAMFYRDYPRTRRYHLKLLPKGVPLVNHGFFRKSALEDIKYIDERSYAFYAADGDLCMRLAAAGHQVVPLHGCLANHLAHLPDYRQMFGVMRIRGAADTALFERRWGELPGAESLIYDDSTPDDLSYRNFWRVRPFQCACSAFANYVRKGAQSRNGQDRFR